MGLCYRGFRRLEGINKRSYCVRKIKDKDFKEEKGDNKEKVLLLYTVN